LENLEALHTFCSVRQFERALQNAVPALVSNFHTIHTQRGRKKFILTYITLYKEGPNHIQEFYHKHRADIVLSVAATAHTGSSTV
jgi:hypothetical protein